MCLIFLQLFINGRNCKLLKTVTSPHRGTKSERNLVIKLLRDGIPPQTIFHDMYVQKRNGTFSQIDVVVPTAAGIIVFEVKDMGGWIYGKGYHSQWTQVLAYGKEKYRFYNPIMQNNKHIEVLKKQLLQFKHIPFYSIVVFYGGCVLKDVTSIPDGTLLVKPKTLPDVLQMIKNYPPAPYTDKHEVLRILREGVNNGEKCWVKDRIFD